MSAHATQSGARHSVIANTCITQKTRRNGVAHACRIQLQQQQQQHRKWYGGALHTIECQLSNNREHCYVPLAQVSPPPQFLLSTTRETSILQPECLNESKSVRAEMSASKPAPAVVYIYIHEHIHFMLRCTTISVGPFRLQNEAIKHVLRASVIRAYAPNIRAVRCRMAEIVAVCILYYYILHKNFVCDCACGRWLYL